MHVNAVRYNERERKARYMRAAYPGEVMKQRNNNNKNNSNNSNNSNSSNNTSSSNDNDCSNDNNSSNSKNQHAN